MTSLDGGKKNWLLAIAASLLLHLPVVILLSLYQPGKTITEPDLKLSLRSAAPAPKAAQRPAETPKAGPRAETAPPKQQAKPRPAPKPEETKKTAESRPAAAAPGAARENAPKEESVIDRRETAPAARQSSDMAGEGAPRTGPVEVSSLKIIKEVVPDYPAFSRKRGEEGEARIIVTIKDGAVTAAEIYKSSGSQRLDQSALRAARQWRFAAAGDARAVIPFIFSLSD